MAAPRGAMRNIAPTTPARAQSPATAPLAAVWPAWSVGCSLPPKHHPAQVRGRRSPPACTRPPQRYPQPCSSGRRPSRQGLDPTTWNSTRSSQDRCPAVPRSPYRQHPAEVGRDGCDRADGRTPDGRTPDGLDTSRLDSRVRTRDPDGRTLDGLDTGRLDTWTSDGWTPGPRTAGRVGRTPKSGHSLAMDSRQPSWHPDHCDEDPTAGMLSRSSAGQTSRGPIRDQDSSAREDPAGSWPPPRQTGVGDPPPSGRRLGALLSCVGVGGYEQRAMGQRKGKGVRSRAGQGVLMGCLREQRGV
jgi:hypothetical protein